MSLIGAGVHPKVPRRQFAQDIKRIGEATGPGDPKRTKDAGFHLSDSDHP